jgi:inorganic pyrophosphatase
VLVFLDAPAQVGTLVKVRLIGGIRAEQKEKGEDWVRNDRLLSVADHSKTLADVTSLDDLRPKQVDELVDFFTQYNRLEGKKFRSLGNCDARTAASLLKAGAKKAKK